MSAISIRDAQPEDVAAILILVRELATFEHAADQVMATEADLLRDGFGPNPRFSCRIAEIDGRPVGFALWFFNYSTWLGRAGIFVEDLYVAESARRHGVGEALMRDIAALAVHHGAGRLDLNVLSWNPARSFYERLGLRHLEEWMPYRITGAALCALAEPKSEQS